MHAVRMSLKYTFKVFLPLLLYYCPAPREVFAWLFGVAYELGFLGLARGSVWCGCRRRGLSGLYSLALRNLSGLNDALLVSSSVATLSSCALSFHMQKPLADAPARVGGDGPSVGAHDPMVGDDHGEWVFSHRGPHGAV